MQLLDRYRDGKHRLGGVPAAPAKLALPWNDQVKHTSGTRVETVIDTVPVIITMQLQSVGMVDLNMLYIFGCVWMVASSPGSRHVLNVHTEKGVSMVKLILLRACMM